ncbi:GntR family transcriptional regulator [Phaeovulum sp.]|uniref:GntR family transcriptional regulator n=1 Tax=Phaeovulum sp. TaxID=2934796 RepID=UPI0039E6B67A
MAQFPQIPEVPLAPGITDQEGVYQRLRAAIMTGAIEPGTTLTFRGLAEVLSCSPTPIREAVRRLSSEHAIEVLGNRRMQIPAMTPARFEEILSLRGAIESYAAVRALPYVSEILIDEIVELDTRMDQAIENHDPSHLTVLNHQFHRQLYTANPHQVAMPIIESIWMQLGPFQRQVIETGLEYYVIDRHQEIIRALRARDAIALSVAIEADIRDGIYRSGKQFLQNCAADTLSRPD